MSRPRLLSLDTRALLRLAGPIVLAQIAQVLSGFLDTAMAGHAGAMELAVVGVGVALWIPVYMGLMSVVQAVSPLIAQAHGAQDRAAVVRDARQGLWLAVGASLVALALLPGAPAVLTLAGVAPPLAGRVGVFLWGVGLGLPAALCFQALAFYSASIGLTRPVMVLSLVSLAVNGLLNWVLIYGHWGLPAMGGAGCGWATGIGMWLGLLALVVWTARSPAYRDVFLWRGWQWPNWPVQRRLLRVGLPMGAAALAEVTAFAGIALLMGPLGEVQIAAHQIALNFSALIFMLPLGLASALTIRVGHALGAGDPGRGRAIARNGLVVGWTVAAVAIGPIVVLRHAVAAVYSNDPAVQVLAANLLLFAAFWQLFDATQVCAIGALRGYRRTLMPMVLMLIAFWAIGIPLGTFLAYRGLGHGGWQVYGFWAGLATGLVLVSVTLVVWLRRVAWQAVAAAATTPATWARTAVSTAADTATDTATDTAADTAADTATDTAT